jgi:hypothetical protein
MDDLGLPIPHAQHGPRIALFAPHRTGSQYVIEKGWDRRVLKWTSEIRASHDQHDQNDVLATLSAAAVQAVRRENKIVTHSMVKKKAKPERDARSAFASTNTSASADIRTTTNADDRGSIDRTTTAAAAVASTFSFAFS